MNRKQFQEWLNQFPEDTEIQVGIQQEAPNYCPYGEVQFEKFVGEEYVDYDYSDFTGNPRVKVDASWYNKRILRLGRSE